MSTHDSLPSSGLEALAKRFIDRLVTLSAHWDLTRAELASLIESNEEQLPVLLEQPSFLAQAIREKDTRTWIAIVELLQIEWLLTILFTNEEHLHAWIKTPNAAPLFGGGEALEFLLLDPARNRSLVIGYLWGVCNCNFS